VVRPRGAPGVDHRRPGRVPRRRRGPCRLRWHLARIYVAPDRRGEGIGTALLDRIESALADRGVTRYELAVLSENAVGIGFYESRGLECFDERAIELAGVETTEYWYRKRL
jgi:ribosomal protein S18 acetylase RimI-like enzyme